MAARVLRAQVAMLYANAASSTAIDALIAWLLTGVLWWQLRDPMIGLWLLLHLTQVLRYPVLAGYRRDAAAAQRSRHWARVHGRELLMYSSVWGLAPWLMLPADDLPMTVLLMLVMLGLVSGGVAAVSAYWRSTLCFAVPMVAGLVTALAWRGDGLHLFLAGCALLYLGATLFFARQQNRLLIESLSVRFEKEALSERLHEQMAAVQRASAEKTRFLSAASHDLRQPLHAIALFGATLHNELDGHAAQPNVQRLMGAVHALGSSLDAMLDISQLDAGVVAPEVRPLPLQPLLELLFQVFEPEANRKELELRIRASALWVHSDAQLLQRLLSNLVDNALKYSRRGGVLVRARARGERVWIDVCDTGIGIAPEHQDRVFDEFFQAHNPGRDRSQGLGVGLSIVKRLALLLDHPIALRSRMGRGTCFRLALPRAEPMPAPARAPAASPAPAAGSLPRRVLLIDDEADVRDAMLALLRSAGVEATAARDESHALDAWRYAAAVSRPFDLTLCDYRLAGGADGLAMAQRLRERTGLPVLMITGETDPQRLQRLRDAGLPVLFKPVYAEALLQTLADLPLPAARR